MARLVVSGLLLAAATPVVRAEQQKPVELEGIGVDENVGKPVDLGLEFLNERGYPEPLSKTFAEGKPVLVDLVYYTCPMLCNLILNGQVETLRQIPWTPGDEFNVVTISINPNETFDLAAKKRQMYLTSYDRPAPGWHFYADYEGHAKILAEQLGDHYRWDERGQQFAHTAVVFVLTPKGIISRYLYGIKHKPLDMRLALTEAAENKYSLSVDRLLLFCFHYDPSSRSYAPFARNLMKAGGAVSVVLIVMFVWGLARGERKRTRTPVTRSSVAI